MASTILLDNTAWDLVLDANGNIAAATEPYSLAQDAASALRTWLGEVWWDTAIGVPYASKIMGKNPPIALVRALLQDAALTVEGVASARCIITSLSNRVVAGQVQVTSTRTGQTSAASFSAINPQVF